LATSLTWPPSSPHDDDDDHSDDDQQKDDRDQHGHDRQQPHRVVRGQVRRRRSQLLFGGLKTFFKIVEVDKYFSFFKFGYILIKSICCLFGNEVAENYRYLFKFFAAFRTQLSSPLSPYFTWTMFG
jgi:hypothetical protein